MSNRIIYFSYSITTPKPNNVTYSHPSPQAPPMSRIRHCPFIHICADEDVIRYFLKNLSRGSTAFMQRLKDAIEMRGWILFAVELKDTGEFIGFIGLHVHPPEIEMANASEIGRRLFPEYQSHVLHCPWH